MQAHRKLVFHFFWLANLILYYDVIVMAGVQERTCIEVAILDFPQSRTSRNNVILCHGYGIYNYGIICITRYATIHNNACTL